MTARILVVLPAYNAQATLAATLGDIPPGLGAERLLVDDASRDRTVEIARALGLEVVVHPQNRGYGGNQKTCYTHALRRGAARILMLHPDHQYGADALPAMVEALDAGADVVLGSRFLGPPSDRGGMPWWRALGNGALTAAQNMALGLHLSEYHTGLRGYRAEALARLPFHRFDDGFLFDQQLLVTAARMGMTIAEVRARARYFPDASSISFKDSVAYGLATLKLIGSRPEGG